MVACLDQSPLNGMLDRQAAATYLGLATATLAAWACTGKHRTLLPFVRYGKRVLYRRADLDRFLASQLEPAACPPS